MRAKRRICRGEYCTGLSYDVTLCDDSTLCGAKQPRLPIGDYIDFVCEKIASKITLEDRQSIKYKGIRGPYIFEKPSLACTVFCELTQNNDDGITYYAVVEDSAYKDTLIDPYLPDGTWCHAEKDQNYFCRKHRCVMESIKVEKCYPSIY